MASIGSSIPIVANKEYAVAYSLKQNGASVNPAVKTYVDGELVGSVDPAPTSYNSGNIGSYFLGKPAVSGNLWKGDITDVKVFGSALSETAIYYLSL